MTKLEREAYINAALKYSWMLSILQGLESNFRKNHIIYNLRQWDNSELEKTVYGLYCDLKTAFVYQMKKRKCEYEQNRDAHKEQKTADKQFYRFLQATGFTYEVDPTRLKISRLIKIYSVYFKDLGKMKKDLDKAGKSPYIG